MFFELVDYPPERCRLQAEAPEDEATADFDDTFGRDISEPADSDPATHALNGLPGVAPEGTESSGDRAAQAMKAQEMEADQPLQHGGDNLAATRAKQTIQNSAKNAAKKVAKEATKEAGKAVAEHSISAALGGVTGGVSVAADAVWTAVSAAWSYMINNRTGRKILEGGALLLIVIGITMIYIGLSWAGLVRTPGGANLNGGRVLQQVNDSYAPAVGAQASGIIMGDSIESMDIAVNQISTLLSKNPPAGANVAKAQNLLQQINDLKGKIRANGSSARAQTEALYLKQYKALVQQLIDAIYPGRSSVRQQVLALVGKKITLETAGSCKTDRDLKGSGLTQNLLNVILAAANHTNITISCLITGHRKYVNHPPSAGYPRCGSPSTFGSDHSQSWHCLGRAVDLKPDSALKSWLIANKTALHIRYIGDEGNHIHVEVNP